MSYLFLLHVGWVDRRLNSEVAAKIEGSDRLACQFRLNGFSHTKVSNLAFLGITCLTLVRLQLQILKMSALDEAPWLTKPKPPKQNIPYTKQ
jgi:hypothetical protein